MIFEGEYINDEKWKGRGRDYGIFDASNIEHKCLNGQLLTLKGNFLCSLHGRHRFFIGFYECELLNGKRNGKGKVYYDNDKLLFEGEYLSGKRNGKGKEYDFDGNLIFEGEYINGQQFNGKEKECNKNGKLYII